MISLCTHLLETVQATWDTIVVVGAGNGSPLAAVRPLRPDRLILVEPHPDQADALSRQIRPEKGEEIRQVAITAQDAPHVSLHVFTNPAYNSLRPPLKLNRFAPNLREKASIQVPAVTVTTFLQDLKIDPDTNNLLVVAAPGHSTELMAGVHPRLMQMFSWLLVTGHEIPDIYQGEEPMDNLEAKGEELGFDIVLRDPDCLYPQAAALLRRDTERVRLTSLKQEVATLQDKLNSGEKLLADSQERIRSLEEENNHLAKLAQERQDAISSLTKKRDELAAKNTALAKERDEQADIAKKRQNTISSLTAERDALTQEKANISQKRDELAKLAQERQDAISSLTKKRDELAAKNTTLAKERDEQADIAKKRQNTISSLTAERDALTQEKANISQKRDELAKLAQERQDVLDTRNKERNDLEADIAELKKNLDTARAQVNEKNNRITELESCLAEMEQRQQLLQDELVKGEAQIDLIKDLLLREPGL